MFCRFCGVKIPEDSRFCPQCGAKLAPPSTEASPSAPSSGVQTTVFSFPPKTTYDQAALPVTEWLEAHTVDLLDLRCQADTVLLAGTLVPVLERLELDYVEGDDPRHYQLGIMLDSRNDFGLSRKRNSAALDKQFQQWLRSHPDYEVSCKVDLPLSLGWCSGSLSLFCYR